jgi:predicted transposase/invertase (TIGR01784 family)
MQFVDVTTDIAFKKVFGSEQHKDILIGFLNAVLDLQGDRSIREVTLKNPWQAPDIAILKETILDIKAVDNRGVSFIVEMQVEKKYSFQKRAQYYTAKAYTGQIDKGEDYPKLGQVIFIGILDFSCFDGTDYLTRHLILNQATQKQELKDLEFNFIELPKFDRTEEQLDGIIEKWVYFIKNAGSLTIIPKSAASIPELNNAYTQAAVFSWNKDELDVYEYWRMEATSDRYKLQEEYEKGIEKGIEKGVDQGIDIGEMKNRLETVRKMKLKGFCIEDVMDITGLSREEIELRE